VHAGCHAAAAHASGPHHIAARLRNHPCAAIAAQAIRLKEKRNGHSRFVTRALQAALSQSREVQVWTFGFKMELATPELAVTDANCCVSSTMMSGVF
jgi:hypothetical protein